MYQQDILIRYLTVFLQRLAEFLNNQNSQDVNEETIERYNSEMLGIERNSIVNLNVLDILEKFNNGALVNEKMRILAELFYIEALIIQNDDRQKMAEKSLQLFHHLNEHTKTLDFDIITKMNNLSQIMKHE